MQTEVQNSTAVSGAGTTRRQTHVTYWPWRRRTALIAPAIVLLLAAVLASARDAAVAPGVDIGGEGVKTAHLSLADLAKLPHVRVHASAHGSEADWEGVPLIELLKSAGAPSGETLRGPALALYVRVAASDGYRVVFALGYYAAPEKRGVGFGITFLTAVALLLGGLAATIRNML